MTVLHSFAGELDGANPYAGLIMDASGNVVTSSNPAGGATAWTLTNAGVDAFNYVSGVSCPSSGLCVAVDRSGNVVTGT